MTQAAEATTDTLSSQRILIVDDEPGICCELEKIFSDAGYVVSSINSSEELFQALEERPALILLDIWMPGKDGMEVLKELQSLDNPPQVIMMSGHATIATAVKATQMGAYDFIEKPLDIELLLGKVKSALEESDASNADTLGTGDTETCSQNKVPSFFLLCNFPLQDFPK